MRRKSRRHGAKPHGRWYWPLRAAWLIAAALAVLVALQVSIAGLLRERNPSLSLAWLPNDAEARAQLAVSLVTPGASLQARDAAIALAHDAIQRDPLNVVALRVLAKARDDDGGIADAKANAIIAQAQRLSRRDMPTQVWLVEQALLRGNLDAAMQHFDIGFRTSTSGRETLFPLLANASADPRMATAIKERLRRHPDWGTALVLEIMVSAPPALATEFAMEFLDAKKEDERRALAAFTSRLADQGEYELAEAVYTKFVLGPALASSTVMDGGFDKAQAVAPFAWTLAEQDNLWAAREPEPERGQVLVLAANSGLSGEAARQLIKLTPGTYRIRAVMGEIPDDPFERPRLVLRCAEDGAGRELLALRPAAGGPQARRIEGQATVPAQCPYQWLSIAIAGDGPPSETLPWIDDIEVVKGGG